MLEENLLKSCLKRKVTFTTSTLVKFLITGTVALSLTACGGGGGGSSSSGGNGGVIEKPFEENKTDRTETIETENQNFINKGNIDLTGNKKDDSVVGIIGKNSDITNESEIKINDISANNSKVLLVSETGENILKEFQNQGKSFAIFAEGGKVVNGENGKLNITGDNVTGIVGVYSDITNDGKIITSDNIDDTKEAVGIMAIGSNVTNSGDIKLASNKGIGIWGVNNSNVEIINNGTITINSTIKEDNGNEEDEVYLEDFSYGIKTNGKVTNSGTINITGTAIGMTGKNVINNGTINITGIKEEDDEKVKTPIGIFVTGNDSIATNNNLIKGTENFTVGMAAFDGATAINGEKGVITTDRAFDGYNGKIINYGKAETTGHTAEISGGTLENYGTMSSSSEAVIFSENGVITNKGNIITSGSYVDGAEIFGGKMENYGKIDINSNTSDGISVEDGGKAFNKAGGIINVNGEGSYGMAAYGKNSKVTNEKGGIINVNGKGAYGMVAREGGKIENNGTININNSQINSEDEAKKYALSADNEADIVNTGEINFKGNAILNTDENSSYTIGTKADGSYGKISAEKVSVDGNVRVSAEMAEGSYRSSYALDDVFAGKTEFGKNYKLSSTSLLYSASSKVDEKGNLDVELTRNNRTVADFTNKNFVQAAGIFDKAFADEEYRNTLSESDKALVDKIFGKTTSAKEVDEAIKQVSGYEYGNIARQMFDTKDLFKSYDKSIIDSLGDYAFNFNFIGAYADVDSKHGIAGYDSKVTGIAGAMKFTDSLYGVIGYGYNDIDYDGNSDGNIQTVHTGLYKDIKSVYGNIRLGVFGEYNFHETDRDVLGEKADSDFNSYLAGTEAEISRKFGDDLYFKPALSFDVTYGKYEDFTENGSSNLKVESQDYVSAVPAIELRAGKMFGMSEVYSAVKYSYEFGDMNKSQDMELFEKFAVENDNIKNAQTDLKLGTVINVKNISVNAEIGKEFGKRDREYVKAGFTYTF